MVSANRRKNLILGITLAMIAAAVVFLIVTCYTNNTSTYWYQDHEDIYAAFAGDGTPAKLTLPEECQTAVRNNWPKDADIQGSLMLIAYSSANGIAISRSEDKGRVWSTTVLLQDVSSPNTICTIRVGFSAHKTGWLFVSGYDNTYTRLLMTENGGESWRKVEVQFPAKRHTSLVAGAFRDSQYGYIVERENGKDQLLLTHNAGETWSNITLPFDVEGAVPYQIEDISFDGPYAEIKAKWISQDAEMAQMSLSAHSNMQGKDGGTIWTEGERLNCFELLFRIKRWEHEKIGADRVYLGATDAERVGSHGWGSAVYQTLDQHNWTVSFEELHSTLMAQAFYMPGDVMTVNSSADGESIWLKISSGAGADETIYTVPLHNGEVEIDLSSCRPGAIALWLVVDAGKAGTINVDFSGTIAETPQ